MSDPRPIVFTDDAEYARRNEAAQDGLVARKHDIFDFFVTQCVSCIPEFSGWPLEKMLEFGSEEEGGAIAGARRWWKYGTTETARSIISRWAPELAPSHYHDRMIFIVYAGMSENLVGCICALLDRLKAADKRPWHECAAWADVLMADSAFGLRCKREETVWL